MDIVEVLALLPHNVLMVYVLVPDWSVCREPSRLLLVRLLLVLAYYSGLMLFGTDVGKAYIWKMAIMEFLFRSFVPFVALLEMVLSCRSLSTCILFMMAWEC